MHYITLVDLYSKLESTPKRMEKVILLAKFLSETPHNELDQVILLLQGTVFSAIDEKKMGVATHLVSKAIALATGQNSDYVEECWKRTGDLGDTAFELSKTKKQQTLFMQKLTISKVFANIKKLSEIEGAGSVDIKGQYIAELLTSAEPNEARYIVRTVLGDMRIGAGDGLLRDALVWGYYPSITNLAFECTNCNIIQPFFSNCVFCKGELGELNCNEKKTINANNVGEVSLLDGLQIIITPNEKIAREIQNCFLDEVQEALDIFNDFPLVAKRAKMRTIKKLLESGLIPGKPIKAMLFQKVASIPEAFITVGKPAAFEYKYDGFRLQIHRNGNIVKLFTRRLDEVTSQFPDVVEIVNQQINSHDYIVDCEIVGFDKNAKRFMPFQDISQRIQRKYDVHSMKKEVPVQIILFDIMELNGKTLLQTSFFERRNLLKSIISEKECIIELAQQLVTDKEDEASEFYKLALNRGTEGMMIKSLSAPYKPGARVGYGVKIKPTMDTLDLVIIGGEWGEGKRTNWLSSFMVACKNDDGTYLELGKVGTGFKEIAGDGLTLGELTEQLKPHIINNSGKEIKIKPTIVLELAFEEIQKSHSYSSGFALRFPRLVRLRTDKKPEDCSPLSYVQQLFGEQN